MQVPSILVSVLFDSSLACCDAPFTISEDTVECIWRSSQFRAAIRRKFDEVIVSEDASVNSNTIEEQLFVNAKTKDQYLDLSARVIIHFKQLKDQRTLE